MTLQGRLVGGGAGGGFSPVHLDGLNVKREDGSILKYRGYTGFRLPELWALNQWWRVDDYLGKVAEMGGNCVRVFCDWQNTEYGPLTTPFYYEKLEGCFEHVKRLGFYLHVTALCDMLPRNKAVYLPFDPQPDGRLTQQDHVRLVAEICRRVGVALPFEVSNEDTDGDSGGTAGWFNRELFHGLIATRSTWVGDENPRLPDRTGVRSENLTAQSVHLPRGDEFCVKGKTLYESQRQGLGKYPPQRVWTVSGEPTRIAEGTTPRQHADNAAVCELFGGGGLVHGGFKSLPTAHGHETDLQNCVMPGPGEPGFACCEAVRDVWAANLIHPECAARGNYTRGGLRDCPIEHVDRTLDPARGAVRTYAMELDGVMYCVPCDPGPEWECVPVDGWRLEEQGGYEGDGLGGNLLVLTR